METLRARIILLLICGLVGGTWQVWPHIKYGPVWSSFGLDVEARFEDPKSAGRDGKALEVISAFYNYCLANDATTGFERINIEVDSMLLGWKDSPSPAVKFSLSGTDKEEVEAKARRLKDSLSAVIDKFVAQYPQYDDYPISASLWQDTAWGQQNSFLSWHLFGSSILSGICEGFMIGLIIIHLILWKKNADKGMENRAS